MDPLRRTAMIVGVLFIIATAVTILSMLFIGSLLEPVDDPDYFVNVSADEDPIIAGSLLFLICAVAVVLISVFMFPTLRKFNEAMALGYVAFRTIEAITIVAAVVSWLLLLTLGRQYVAVEAPDAAYYHTSGVLLTEAGAWIGFMLSLFLSLGSLILFYALHQLKLVPRLISAWGLAGAILHLAGTVGLMFDSFTDDSALGILTVLPLASVEMVLAGWLIVKGFNQSAAQESPGNEGAAKGEVS